LSLIVFLARLSSCLNFHRTHSGILQGTRAENFYESFFENIEAQGMAWVFVVSVNR
jgi:hypothetical protein